jgi:DNA-binding transcriptional LysR family regulator
MRGNAAFDELRQSVRDIEFLADPTVGEVRIGCQETFAAAILPSVIHRFSQAYPRVVLHVEQLGSLAAESSALRERTIDLGMFLLVKPSDDKRFMDDLNVEVLFHDKLVVAAGRQSRWARRRKVDLAELVDEPWVTARLPRPPRHHRFRLYGFLAGFGTTAAPLTASLPSWICV